MKSNELFYENYKNSIIVGEVIPCNYETPHPYIGSNYNVPLWSVNINFHGASFITPHFKNFQLAEGDYVIVRSPDNKQKYKYEKKGIHDRGNFLSYKISGDTAIIELYSKDKNSGYGFIIDSFERGFSDSEIEEKNNITFATSSWENIKCVSGDIYNKAKAVARITFEVFLAIPEPHYEVHMCSAWLSSCEDHLITNSHCISEQWQADDMQIEFMAEASSCSDTSCDCQSCCPGEIWQGTSSPQIVTLSSPNEKDYTLIKISRNSNGQWPSDLYGFIKLVDFADPYIGSKNIYIIHHPYAYAKKITRYKNDGSGVPCYIQFSEQHICSDDEWGYNCATAHGSSGGAVIYQDYLMGILLNNCGYGPGYTNYGVNINKISQDLISYLPDCSFVRPKIYGYITLNGKGMENVKVTACGQTAYTNNYGYYEITNIKADSSCTVKPSYTTQNGIAYSFTPPKKDVNVKIWDLRQDFVVNTYNFKWIYFKKW